MFEKNMPFMVKILEELDEKDMKRLKCVLNTTKINGKTIPLIQLENINAEKVAELLRNYHCPQHLEALRDALEAIPRKDLSNRVSDKIDSEKQEHGNQIEGVDGVPAKKFKFSKLPPYEGKFRLSDMEVYATENQDLLINELKGHLELDAFKCLEEQLAKSKLKNAFSFTGPQYYTILVNQKLKSFLDDVSAGKKSQEIHHKILDILFSPINNNKKREASKFKQQMNRPREKKLVISSLSSFTDEQKQDNEKKELPTIKEKGNEQISKEDIFTKNNNTGIRYNEQGPKVKRKESVANNEKNIQISTEDLDVDYEEEGGGDQRKELANKQKGNVQISKEDIFTEDVDCDEQGSEDERKESPITKEQENVQIFTVDTFTQELDVDYNEQKPVCESKNGVECTGSKKTEKEVLGNEQDEKLARAIRKHYRGKTYSLEPICIREHKKYDCFVAQDVWLFRLEGETEDRILRILQVEKDCTPKGKLKEIVEFEQQFNMAVIGVQSSELISDSTFKRVEAHCFRKHEEMLEKIVSVIVLPFIALYKRVKKLNTLERSRTTKGKNIRELE